MLRRNPASTTTTRGSVSDRLQSDSEVVPLSSSSSLTSNNNNINNINNNNNNKRPARRRRNILFGALIVASLFLYFWRLVVATALVSRDDKESSPAVVLPPVKPFNASSDYDTISFRPTGKVDTNVTIISRRNNSNSQVGNAKNCRNNAIVLLAQKRHATYDRDSYGLLVKALTLLSKNYISRHDHADNVDVFLFHTGDFDYRDIDYLEPLILGNNNNNNHNNNNRRRRRGILKLVNLADTVYWTLPPWHLKDNQTHWKGSDIFPVGYRHMCRWFGIKIWNFFEELNAHHHHHHHHQGCNYRHILRIDEDSFILSPIEYDIFDYMKINQFVYGFRMCAYEMDYNRYIGQWVMRWKGKTKVNRDITNDMCGFYNNFFVADLQFFTSPPVKEYLQQIHRQGFIYRKRYGDLMIHTTAVYSFADPNKIHRFLDFTYQHVTTDHILHPEQGCVVWGGIQAGYKDAMAEQTLASYLEEYVTSKRCTANTTYLESKDLSPTYQHSIVPDDKMMMTSMSLKTITAGRVELSGKGILSG